MAAERGDRDSPEGELDRLAAAGRQRAAERDALRAEARARGDALLARESRHYLLGRVSRYGESHARVVLPAPVALPVLAIAGGAAAAVGIASGIGPLAIPAFFGAALVAWIVAGVWIVPALAERDLRRERRWFAQLPIRVDGYFEVLSEARGYNRQKGSSVLATVEIADLDERDVGLLADIVAGARFGIIRAPERDGGACRMECVTHEGSDASMGRVLHWLVEALILVHARRPITRLQLQVASFGGTAPG